MLRNRLGAGGLLALLLAACLLAVLLAACGGSSPPRIEVQEVWARPAMAGEAAEGGGMMAAPGTGAVFMHLLNEGGEADRLVGGRTDVAETVEIHETVMEGEVMKMRMLPDGLEVPAGEDVLLKPGGYHVMLIGIKHDLQVGESFSLELEFEKSGAMTVTPQVRQP